MPGASANVANSVKAAWSGKAWLLLIPPALVAGLASGIPALIEWMSAPSSRLEYTIITGPALPTGNEYKRIYSVTVVNTGDTKLTSVSATVEPKNGRLESPIAEALGRPDVKISTDNSSATLTAPNLLPGEKVSATMLVSSTTPDASPHFVVRSGETLGVPGYASISSSRSPWLLWTGVLAGFGASLGGLVSGILARRLAGRVPGRDDVIWFITQRLNLEQLDALMPSSIGRVTFMAMADLLERFVRKEVDAENKHRAMQALKALLVAPNMWPSSRASIVETIKGLDGSFSDLELQGIVERSSEARTQVGIRRVIRDLIPE